MNSLKIVLAPINAPDILSAKLWIRDGSRADPDDQKGIHQLYCSLLSRGCGPYSNLELADIIEGCGAGLRCDTYEDGILLSLKCASNDGIKLLPLLGWMINEPHLKNEQLNLEKELTLQALLRQKENPFHLAFDGWRKLAFGNGSYGHDPLGSESDIKKICQDNLLPLSKEIKNRKKVLVIAGTIPNHLDEILYKKEPFKNTKTNTNSLQIKNNKTKTSTSRLNSKNYVSHNEKTKQVVIMLGKPTIPHSHRDELGLRLLSTYLGTGMSSYLFRILREKHGLAYEVGVYHPVREENSPFLIHAATTQEKSKDTLRLLKECWVNTIERPLPENEMKLIKAKFRGQIAHSLQSISQRAERKAHLIGLELREDHDQRALKEMEEITSQDLLKIGQRHLKSPLLSLCGPQHCLNELLGEWNKYII